MDEIGLLRRYIVHRTPEAVIFNEVWNLDTPGCPIVRANLSGLEQPSPGEFYLKQVIMSPDDFLWRNPQMKG